MVSLQEKVGINASLSIHTTSYRDFTGWEIENTLSSPLMFVRKLIDINTLLVTKCMFDRLRRSINI